MLASMMSPIVFNVMVRVVVVELVPIPKASLLLS